jgi:hypothetical protein
MKIPVVILVLTVTFLLVSGCMAPAASVISTNPDDQFQRAWQVSEERVVNYARDVTNTTDLQVMAKLSEDMIKDIDNTTEEISRINVSINYTPIKQEYLSALDYLRLTCADIIGASHANTTDEAQEYLNSAIGNLKEANLHRVWVEQKMPS